MRLPDVLIIGAMKSGTTGLYTDLACHPQFFQGQDKEPHCLCDNSVVTGQGIAAYSSLYEQARRDQICCDASTGYSKLPDFPNVVQHAVQLLPDGFKVIYIVRHPIHRIISQHHHEYFQGKIGPSIDGAVRRHARFVQYSRYGYQLRPWLDAIGPERVRVVPFEKYRDQRTETVKELWRFLGLGDFSVNSDEVINASEGKPFANSAWTQVRDNALYRNAIRPLTSPRFRSVLRRLLLPKARGNFAPPRPDTLAYLQEALAADLRDFYRMLGCTSPIWPELSPTGDGPGVSETPIAGPCFTSSLHFAVGEGDSDQTRSGSDSCLARNLNSL